MPSGTRPDREVQAARDRESARRGDGGGGFGGGGGPGGFADRLRGAGNYSTGTGNRGVMGGGFARPQDSGPGTVPSYNGLPWDRIRQSFRMLPMGGPMGTMMGLGQEMAGMNAGMTQPDGWRSGTGMQDRNSGGRGALLGGMGMGMPRMGLPGSTGVPGATAAPLPPMTPQQAPQINPFFKSIPGGRPYGVNIFGPMR